MLALARLFVLSILLTLVASNTEKTIFVAPPALAISTLRPGLDDLRLASIAPAKPRDTLRTQLEVAFPTRSTPRGTQHWYILDGLKAGQRYEVRVCWVATQPTEFWLAAYPLQEVFETPSLISALAAYSQQRKELTPSDPESHRRAGYGADNSTILLLRIHSAADFYTTNKTLMSNPPPVGVDIILDPYLLNVLPRSLVPTILYILVLAIGSWYLAGAIWTWLMSIEENGRKEHRE